jgi:hypothetical protein
VLSAGGWLENLTAKFPTNESSFLARTECGQEIQPLASGPRSSVGGAASLVLDHGAVIRRRPSGMATARDRMSLRKTGLIHAPQHPPPTNRLCHYTHYGLAPDIRSRTAAHHIRPCGAVRRGRGTRAAHTSELQCSAPSRAVRQCIAARECRQVAVPASGRLETQDEPVNSQLPTC